MSGLLIINSWESKCGECGKSCNPNSKTHDKILGYGDQNGTPGCGVEWDRLTSHYLGSEIEAAARHMRPDLIWEPLFDGPQS